MNKNLIRTGTAAVLSLFLIVPFQNCSPQKFYVNEKTFPGKINLAIAQVSSARTPANSGTSTLESSVRAGQEAQATATRTVLTTTFAPGTQVAQAAATATPAASALHLDFGEPVTGKNLQGGKYPFDVGFIQLDAYQSNYAASKIVTLSGLPAKGALFRLRNLTYHDSAGLEGAVFGNINEEINALTNPTPNLLNLSVNVQRRIVRNGDRIRMYGWPSAFFDTEASSAVELVDIDDSKLLASGSFSVRTTPNPYRLAELFSLFFTNNNVSWNNSGPIFSNTLTISGMGAGLQIPIIFGTVNGLEVIVNGEVLDRNQFYRFAVKDGDTIKFRWDKPAAYFGTVRGGMDIETPGLRDESIPHSIPVSFNSL